MNWFTILVVFIITWWTVLFAVLPFGVRRAQAVEPGEDPGAPERPRLGRKALVTTAIAAVITAAVFGVVESDLLSLRGSVTPWVPEDGTGG